MSNNIRKQYTGGAVATQLNGAIVSGTTSIFVDDASTYPTGATPFVVEINGTAVTAEKVLVTRAGTNTLTAVTRGYDGTTAQSHADNSPVEHVLDAFTVDQVNYLANMMTTTGDLLYKASSSTFGRLAVGANAQKVLGVAAGLPAWVDRPIGRMGSATVTANQGSITTAVDLTGLTVTFTGVSGRYYRVTGQVLFQSTVAGDIALLTLLDGATQLQAGLVAMPTANVACTLHMDYLFLSAGGSKTFKLAGARNTGTGTLTMAAGATFPAHLIVEDIGV